MLISVLAYIVVGLALTKVIVLQGEERHGTETRDLWLEALLIQVALWPLFVLLMVVLWYKEYRDSKEKTP